jgi:hypothetical protein
MNGNESAALAVASDQYGVVSRAQLREQEMTDGPITQRLRAGRLLVCHPGVFRVAGASQTSRQRAMAACL